MWSKADRLGLQEEKQTGQHSVSPSISFYAVSTFFSLFLQDCFFILEVCQLASSIFI